MRSLWTGSLSFGLINIPVKLYGAAEDRGGIAFDYLHRTDMTPISYVRVCDRDGQEVPLKDIVKGYKYKEGEYVVLEQEDFDRANLQTTKTIDIHAFTDEESIDSVYRNKPYFLLPSEGGEKGYTLLYEALSQAGKVGIVTFVMRNRGRLGYVKAYGPLIMLQRLYFASDVRDPSFMDVPHIEIAGEEIDVATALVSFLTKPFSIEDYHDIYTEELQHVINKKIEGKEPGAVRPAEPEPTPPDDLMKLLRASIGSGRSRFSSPKKGEKKRAPPKRKKGEQAPAGSP